MDDVHEFLADHAEVTTGGGNWVRIYAGHTIIEAVAFTRQPNHNRLAWVETDSMGAGLFLDIGSIYAVEDVDMAALE